MGLKGLKPEQVQSDVGVLWCWRDATAAPQEQALVLPHLPPRELQAEVQTHLGSEVTNAHSRPLWLLFSSDIEGKVWASSQKNLNLDLCITSFKLDDPEQVM